MADYPTPSGYQEALQAPEVAFADAELQAATPRTNALGLPQPITGAFASVFPMTTETGARYAVKCFLTEVPDQQARYEAVADALDTGAHDALVEFGYQPEGIRVDGMAYPLLKMEWVEGTPLNRFVEAHLEAPEVLDRLAEAWATLMADLETLDLAHGDLQHGNVLVQTAGKALRLRLVDYDTMYVPALDGWNSAEVGHRNYQHPDRTETDFGPSLDRFAGLVIYTALRACAVEPDLWARFDTGENLLFCDADFYAPDESSLFDELSALDPAAACADALRTACYVEPADVPPLAAVREGRLEPSQMAASRSSSRTGRTTPSRRGMERAFLPAVLAVIGGALALAAVGWGGGALALLAIAGGGGGIQVARGYRQLSLVRRRRRLEREAERFASAIRGLEREVESLQDKRSDLRTSVEARRRERLEEIQEETLRDCLKHHFIGEAREVDGLTHKHIVRLKSANVRTAAEATPEALDQVRRISDRARARLKMWRAALEEQYADEVPDSLSPAQERRLQRYVQHRIEDVDAQLARTREKIRTQEVERERIEERLDEMPYVTGARYVAYLLRLSTLPARDDGSPTPPARKEVDEDPEWAPVPDPVDEDRSWWERSN